MAVPPPSSNPSDLDRQDPLRELRNFFHVPQAGDIAAAAGGHGNLTGDAIYMCGNSLGLMPRSTSVIVEQELRDWTRLGVAAHGHAARPWVSYHEQLREPLARLVGAKPSEVVGMNSLTANLHFLMASFYRPNGDRTKILIEDAAFPSDSYAMQSQAAWHDLDPREAVLRLRPRDGEATLRTDDVIEFLDRHGDSIAVVMLGAVNYLTGQWFDMAAITAAGRARGCIVGWDLAHAAGNVPMRLHDWGADFAAWCSYKYLNAGPGALAGAYVHERHHADMNLPRLAGWWGNDPATRFRMEKDFVPVRSADAWQVSNPPILSAAPLIASLEIFDKAGMEALRAKSVALTGYMEGLIRSRLADRVKIATPMDPARRGCQLSLVIAGADKALERRLARAGVVVDYREPSTIRVAPAPLYNTFADVYAFVEALERCMAEPEP